MSHCLLTSYQCLCPPPSPPLFSLLLPPPFPLAVSAQHLPACAERVVRPHHRPAPLRGRLGASWSVGASPCLPAAPSPAGKGEKREREGEGGREGGRDKVEGVTEGRGSLPSSHSVEEHPLASEFINLTRITRLPCPFPAPPPPAGPAHPVGCGGQPLRPALHAGGRMPGPHAHAAAAGGQGGGAGRVPGSRQPGEERGGGVGGGRGKNHG